MAVKIYHKGLTIYGKDSAKELIIMCHGGWTEGGGTVKVPPGTQIRFYTGHWVTSSGGKNACALAGDSSNWTAKPTSIVGPGSPVWNYALTWDGPGGMRPHERGLINQYKQGDSALKMDLITPDEGITVTLKDVFKVIDASKTAYDVVHYCPCRSVADKKGDDVREPFLAEQIASGKTVFK